MAKKQKKKAAPEKSNLTPKQLKFVDAYMQTGSGVQAAMEAGYGETYTSSSRQGVAQLENPKIAAEIQRRFALKGVSEDEIVGRLAMMARGNMGDFLDVNEHGEARLDLRNAKKAKKLGLIKKFQQTKTGTVTVELYSALAALEKLARIRGMLKDKLVIEDFDTLALDMIKKGEITYDAMVAEGIAPDRAEALFKQAGVPISQSGPGSAA